jgi:hypothetical protein
MAVAAAAREALWINKLIETFRFNNAAMPMLIRMDSESALALVRNPVVLQRSKHIVVLHHVVRERASRGDVTLEYCSIKTLHLYAATYSHYSLSLATTQSSIAELLLLFNHNILGCLTTT